MNHFSTYLVRYNKSLHFIKVRYNAWINNLKTHIAFKNPIYSITIKFENMSYIFKHKYDLT